MSSAGEVLIKEVELVTKHPNADLLELVKLKGFGYTLISGLGQFAPGDLAVFFPIDSVLPEELIVKLDMVGKFDGKLHNRVKTKKLRGVVSQGFIAQPDSLFVNTDEVQWHLYDGLDVSEALGIVKWEPEPDKIRQDGRLRPLPLNVYKYDIEGVQKFDEAVHYLMDKSVIVSEKLEGMNYTIAIDSDGRVSICSRNYAIELTDEEQHDFHTTAHRLGYFDLIRALWEDIASAWTDAPHLSLQTVALRGEFIGPNVQGNIYGLKEHSVRFFDLEVNSVPLSGIDFIRYSAIHGFSTVPYLAISKPLVAVLEGKSVLEYSDGHSLLNPQVLREGVVIKPSTETNFWGLGRLQLKARSPEYLMKTGK